MVLTICVGVNFNFTYSQHWGFSSSYYNRTYKHIQFWAALVARLSVVDQKFLKCAFYVLTSIILKINKRGKTWRSTMKKRENRWDWNCNQHFVTKLTIPWNVKSESKELRASKWFSVHDYLVFPPSLLISGYILKWQSVGHVPIKRSSNINNSVVHFRVIFQ